MGGFRAVSLHRRNTALLLCSFSTVNLANIGSVCVSVPLGSDRAAGGSLCTRSMSSEINTTIINMYMRRAKVLRECVRLCVLVSAKAARHVCVWERGGTESLAPHEEELSPGITEIGCRTCEFRSDSQIVSG